MKQGHTLVSNPSLQETRGWRRVVGVKAYSKDCAYPDIYV
jgi:hypothetical protein